MQFSPKLMLANWRICSSRQTLTPQKCRSNAPTPARKTSMRHLSMARTSAMAREFPLGYVCKYLKCFIQMNVYTNEPTLHHINHSTSALPQALLYPPDTGRQQMDRFHKDKVRRHFANITAILEDTTALAVSGQSHSINIETARSLTKEIKTELQKVHTHLASIKGLMDKSQ